MKDNGEEMLLNKYLFKAWRIGIDIHVDRCEFSVSSTEQDEAEATAEGVMEQYPMSHRWKRLYRFPLRFQTWQYEGVRKGEGEDGVPNKVARKGQKREA